MELTTRHTRRADGALGVAQTRQVLDLVGGCRQGSRSGAHLAQPARHLRGSDARSRSARLGRDVGVYERDKTTQERVVQAITAGIPTKVAGIAETGADVAP